MSRAVLVLLLVAAAFAPALPVAGAACPAAPPLALVQDDAGSGRDAGDLPEGAVALHADGHFWGSLDPPLQTGVQDQHDWFVAEVPAGPREISVEVKSLGKLIDPESSWPFVYWLEVFRPDVGSVAFRGSWEDPVAFDSPGGETLFVNVYIVPLYWWDLCTSAAPTGPSVPAVPAEPQLYRALFTCAPACF